MNNNLEVFKGHTIPQNPQLNVHEDNKTGATWLGVEITGCAYDLPANLIVELCDMDSRLPLEVADYVSTLQRLQRYAGKTLIQSGTYFVYAKDGSLCEMSPIFTLH